MSRHRPYLDLREPTPVLSRVPRRSAPLWTRPLGYGLMTIIWLLMFLFATIAMLVALPVAMSATLDGAPLLDAPLFQRSDWLATVIVIIVVVAPLLGVLTLLLTCATLGVLLSSAALFARSLSPRYRDERLSLSVWTRGETVGPGSAVTGATMSLLPIRMTRWSKIVTIIRFNGFIPSLSLFILGPIWGYGYFWTVAWTLWPARGDAVPFCVAGSVAVAVLFAVIAWRRRHRIAGVMPDGWGATPYAHSWPNRPPTDGRGTGSASARRARRAGSSRRRTPR